MYWYFKRTRAAFILGCQRSGTTICQNVFLENPRCEVFREADRRATGPHMRLRGFDTIRSLLRASRADVALFKPLNDSQRAASLLDAFPDSRVIWIFRDYRDTVNSAVRKWGGIQADIVTTIGRTVAEAGGSREAIEALAGQPDYSMYLEGVSAAVADRLAEWASLSPDANSGAAAMWWLRNQFYTSLELFRDPRVLLVEYEEFVADPGSQMRRMCDHLGLPFEERFVASVHRSSVRHRAEPEIMEPVAAACQQLSDTLRARVAEVPGTPEAAVPGV